MQKLKDITLYWFGILKAAIGYWIRGDALIHSGALAFFTLFSIAPVVILAVQVIGLVLSTDAAMQQIMELLENNIGQEAAVAVAEAVSRTRITDSGLLPTIIGISAMLFGATTVFAQMQRSLNNIWDIAPRPSRNTIFALIKNRLLSLTVVLSIGFVMMVSLLLSVVTQALIVFAQEWLPVPGLAMVILENLVSIAVIALLFATIFKVLPDVILSWRDVLAGALVTALLFILGRYLIALYLSHTATASTYGAAGSLVLLLLWVYYSSLILLFGAAVTRARAEARHGIVCPRATAVRIRRILEDQ